MSEFRRHPRRRMRMEKLESRRMLATYTVDSHTDVVDPGDGMLTLREAVEAANSTVGVRDLIRFDDQLVGSTVVLTRGAIVIADALEINGLGADLLTLDASGNDPTPDLVDGLGSRVFLIEDIDDPRGVTIQGLTLTGGDADGNGGAIGARFVNLNLLTIRDTIIRDNGTFDPRNADGGDGGGMYSDADLTVLERVWIDNNYSGGDGGGIRPPALRIVYSTISNNVSESDGGGIVVFVLELERSTVSGNTSLFGNDGGAIRIDGPAGTISASTIVENSAQSTESTGGITGDDLTVENSIIAQNAGRDLVVSRFAQFRYSLIGVNTGIRLRPTPDGETDANGNIVGTASNPKDPRLGPLTQNGGLTPTHAPLDGSLAINAGDPEFVVEPPGLDQRGQPRLSGARVDMGSVELQLPTSDFNGDGEYGCQDVDLIVSSIASGIHSDQFDITGDGQVDLADLNEWLAVAGLAHELGEPFREGDANLDGVVDGLDFGIWNENRFSATPRWCSGDFNADGFVDGTDFNSWLQARFDGQEERARAPARLMETRGRFPKAPLDPEAEATVLPTPRNFATLRSAPQMAPTYVSPTSDAGFKTERQAGPVEWQRYRSGFMKTVTAVEPSPSEQRQETMPLLVDLVMGTWYSR